MNEDDLNRLHELSRLYNVQTSYYDMAGRCQQASEETLIAVISALGAHVRSISDVWDAIRERRMELARRVVEPVVVVRENGTAELEIRLQPDAREVCILRLEDGQERQIDAKVLETVRVEEVENQSFLVKKLCLPGLPVGYHNLTIEVGDKVFDSAIVCAPRQAWLPSKDGLWGLFLPLHAFHSRDGGGTFGSLGELMEYVHGGGGDIVGTLPLLASFLDEPYDPSPYSPVSRLFWNEFYIDLKSAPLIEGQRSDLPRFVDYREEMARKKAVLEQSMPVNLDRIPGFQRFLKSHPDVAEYARFRATMERRKSSWPSWAKLMQQGHLEPGDYDEPEERYHRYVQWLADEQLREVNESGKKLDVALCMDLPLGVRLDSYDVWRNRDVFIPELSVGAPPDNFFTRGQDWAFKPPHPERSRDQGYRYHIACLRHSMQYAGTLRIDHVMGMHRLFCIPHGFDAMHGVYVRYPAEELYAILCLESQRHQCAIVGENLGTVPDFVNKTMERQGIQRMYVAQYAFAPDPESPFGDISPDCAASLNTHDMPPFAAFWHDRDIRHNVEAGLFDAETAASELTKRQFIRQALVAFLKRRRCLEDEGNLLNILKDCLAYLGSSQARFVIVNTEDLWLEEQPQNVPGSPSTANWRRRTRLSFEEFCSNPELLAILKEVNLMRQRKEVRA